MKSKIIPVKIDEKLKNRFDYITRVNRINKSELIRSWIEEYVQKEERMIGWTAEKKAEILNDVPDRIKDFIDYSKEDELIHAQLNRNAIFLDYDIYPMKKEFIEYVKHIKFNEFNDSSKSDITKTATITWGTRDYILAFKKGFQKMFSHSDDFYGVYSVDADLSNLLVAEQPIISFSADTI